MCIIRLLIDMYTRQKVRASWNGKMSYSFNTTNGVRQGGVLSPILFAVYIDVLLVKLEKSGYGCHVGHEYFGVLGSADDLSLLAPTIHSLRKMLSICEKFGIDYDVVYNATKTVCIHFNGKPSYGDDPHDIYLNGSRLNWVKTIKHLGNIVSWNLSEQAEIKAKMCDFIGRTNSVIANFKGVNRYIVSSIFRSQCFHLYGCQAWDLDSKYIKEFDVTWRKSVRKLWYLPNTARSKILPNLVNVCDVRAKSEQLFCNMYNTICKGFNSRVRMLCNVSVYSNVKGIVGNNVSIISKRSRCGFDFLRHRRDDNDVEFKVRANVIKDISSCLEGDSVLDGFSRDELVMFKNYFACS